MIVKKAGKNEEKRGMENRVKKFRADLSPPARATLFAAIFEKLIRKGYPITYESGGGGRMIYCKGESARIGATSVGEYISTTGTEIPVESLRRKWFVEAIEEVFSESNPGKDFYTALLAGTMNLPWNNEYPIRMKYECVIDKSDMRMIENIVSILEDEFGAAVLNDFVPGFFNLKVGHDFRLSTAYHLVLVPTTAKGMEEMIKESQGYLSAVEKIKIAAKEFIKSWMENPDKIKRNIRKIVSLN